jgi:glycine/serine hydroxymethyltransferase
MDYDEQCTYCRYRHGCPYVDSIESTGQDCPRED